ncbi:uncharacterized protein LUBEL isoform X2 [Bemisia tabaci]|uniref:uncharacterized protein LUBEL isoform X2 n=1 Tax=Bemisia tabaci TaxID=7038 RepID=UPI003B283118
MQRPSKSGEKWKPSHTSNPAARIQGIHKVPSWPAKENSSKLTMRPAHLESPPFDPDYEVIEFPPTQQYTNAPFRPDDKLSSDQIIVNRRCDLCGSSTPCVCCERCSNQTFCTSCDEMYHRHPKRQNHVRKVIQTKSQVLPPLPPKGETFVPPVPPPRRHKRSSRMATPTLEEQSRQCKKESSLMGSLKRFIGGRPLPSTPQFLQDRHFLHSSALPLNSLDFPNQPASCNKGHSVRKSNLNHRSGSLTALNNPFFPPLLQGQSMAHLNCPSCYQHGNWDWSGNIDHFDSPSLAPWARTSTGTWHGSQMLPSACRQQNSLFDDSFCRHPGMPFPPTPFRSSNRSKKDLSQDSYEDESSKANDHKFLSSTSPTLSKQNCASSDSEGETASRCGSRHRKKSHGAQSRETSPALSKHSTRRYRNEFLHRSRRFKKTASRNVSPVRSRKNNQRDLSDSDDNNSLKLPQTKLILSKIKSKESKIDSRSSVESVKDSSSCEDNLEEQEKENIPFVPAVDWECQHCTFINKPGSRICSVCCKTTSSLQMKNAAKVEASEKESTITQSLQKLNISSSFVVNPTSSTDVIHDSCPESIVVKDNVQQCGKALKPGNCVDVNIGRSVASTGTSPPPQSISTQTYDVGGGKLRRAVSLADHDLWKTPTRSVSRQSLLSDSVSLPITPVRTPEDDDSLLNFETQQQAIKRQHPVGRRSFDASHQNIIRPFVRRAGSQPPEYLSTMVKKQVTQGLEMAELLREAQQHHFSTEDLGVALTHCGDTDPVEWLIDNWQNMIDTVVTLATNYGHERKENTIGTISTNEAMEALRMHNGNVWAAVTECIEQRQKKYSELVSRGEFSREDIVTVLTANHGDLNAASRELNKSQLKPFLMRIWGPSQGVDNDSGDISKLSISDSFENAESSSEIDRLNNSKKVSGLLSQDYNLSKYAELERGSKLNFNDPSTEQSKLSECMEGLKNIHFFSHNDDVLSASLKLGPQKCMQQKCCKNLIEKGVEEESSTLNLLENLAFSDTGIRKLPLSSLKGATDFIISSAPESQGIEKKNMPTENRQSYAKEGFSHALKSNFQPYRTVSVCDLSDTNIKVLNADVNNVSKNQINLSTIYYDDAKESHFRNGASTNLKSSNIDREKVIPQLYMEVSHETVNFGVDNDVKDKEVKILTKSKSHEVDCVSLHKQEKGKADEFSDSEIFYESSSMIIDESESVGNISEQTESLNEQLVPTSDTYSVEFQKDLIFIASETSTEIKNTEGTVLAVDRKDINSHNGTKFGVNQIRSKAHSDSEPSSSVNNYRKNSVSDDSGKDYQPIKESSPIKMTKPKENMRTKKLASNIPRPNFLIRKVVGRSGATSTTESNRLNVEPVAKGNVTRSKVPNLTIKSKKKSKLRFPKVERRSSPNPMSSKPMNVAVKEISMPSLTFTEPSSFVPSGDFETKTSLNLDRKKSSSPFSDAPIKEIQNPNSKICKVKHYETENVEIDPTIDCRVESDFRAHKTTVCSKIVSVEPADVDCDDANPHAMAALEKEAPIAVSVLVNSEENALNKEVNSFNSIIKNEDCSCTNNEVSALMCKSGSTETHAGIESVNLDDGIVFPLKSLVENRAEIIQLLEGKLPNNQALHGFIQTLFLSTAEKDQNKVKLVKKISDETSGKGLELNIADTRLSKHKIESFPAASSQDSEVRGCDTNSTKDTQHYLFGSDEIDIFRNAHRLLAEGEVSNFEQAKLVVHLLELNFDKDLCLSAAKECSNIDMALAFLQQECLLCASIYPANQMISMLSCEHLCCRGCALQYFTLQITEHSINDCVCPFCKEPNLRTQSSDYAMNYFSNLDIWLKSFLQPQVHELFQRKLRDRTLMQDPNFRWCSQCSFGFIADLRQKRLTCPDCRSTSCAQCHRLWTKDHEGKTCEEHNEWLESNDPGSMLAKQLVDQGVTCPACHSKYALVKGGCMHLICPACKHEFCSDCSNTFLMGANCKVSPFCEKLGLHAHHPRNCLFFLRDKEPNVLENLLTINSVEFDTTEKENKRCDVQLQRETSDGLIEGICNYQIFRAGLCRKHYVEYLSLLIRRNKLETIDILTIDDFETLLKRAGVKLPPNPYAYPPENHYNDLYKMVKEQIPLE